MPFGLVIMTVLTKSRFRSSIAASALILSIVATPPIAGAASSAVDPTALITDLGTQGIQSLGQAATSAERIARLGRLFQQEFDINGIRLLRSEVTAGSPRRPSNRNSSGCTPNLRCEPSMLGSTIIGVRLFGLPGGGRSVTKPSSPVKFYPLLAPGCRSSGI